MSEPAVWNCSAWAHEVTREAWTAIQESEGTDQIVGLEWPEDHVFRLDFKGWMLEHKARHCLFFRLKSGVVIVQQYIPDEQDRGRYRVMLANS